MKKVNKSILLSFFTCLVPLLYNCGSTTDVSDESKIVGHLYMSDGNQPAQDVKVVLRSHDYLSPMHESPNNPVSPCSTKTNNSGEYVFIINSSFAAGAYTIEAADNKGNCALIDSITVDMTVIENNSDMVLPEDTLKPGCRIEGKITINPDSAHFIVCIPGLDRYTNVNSDGIFAFENLPEGNLKLLVKNAITEQLSSGIVVVKTVTNQTITVDTLIKSGKKYALILTTNGNGTVTGADSVEQGTKQVITAVADSGWGFSVWRIKSGTATIADSLSASTSVALKSGNAEIAAVFNSTPPVKNSYELQLSSNGFGKVNGKASIDTTITSGIPFSVTAVANADYYFRSWHIVEGSAVIGDTLSATTTITLNNGIAVIRAIFSSTPPLNNNFSLHLASNGYGKINGKTGSIDTIIASGTPFTIAAVANADYYFQSWHLSEGTAVIADTLSATTTVTLNISAVDIRAVFSSTPPVKNSYELQLSSNGFGKVNGKASIDTTITSGIPFSVTAVANADYYFRSWHIVEGSAVIGDTLSATTTITLNNGIAVIRAIFSSTPPLNNNFSLHLASNGYGKINGKMGSIDTIIASGIPFTVAAVANADYYFQSWHLSEGTAVIADTLSATTTITLNNSAADIRAVFSSTPPVKELYELQLSSNGFGKVNGKASIDTIITSGIPFSVTAVANADYYFRSWHIVEGSAVIGDTLSATTTITPSYRIAVIEAIFSSTPPINNKYSLHIASNGYGKINGKTGSIDTIIASGIPFTVAAVANADYYFQSWHLSEGTALIADTLSATTTITLNNSAADIRAVFSSTPPVKELYELQLSSNGYGKVNGKTYIDTTIMSGIPFSVTAVANADYYFRSWHIVEGSAVIGDTLSATTTITPSYRIAVIEAIFSSTPPETKVDQ